MDLIGEAAQLHRMMELARKTRAGESPEHRDDTDHIPNQETLRAFGLGGQSQQATTRRPKRRAVPQWLTVIEGGRT